MQDRVVIIAGGGTGIGRATVLQFAQAGAWILVVGRRVTPLEEVASVSDRIRVNAVAPGPTDTGIVERSGLTASIVAHIKAEETERVPLGRRGTAEEVAAWIVDLANPAARWMTGQVIAIDGGLSIA